MTNNKNDRKYKANVRFRKHAFNIGSLIFCISMGILLIISALFWLRPKYSESEKRNLASFPKFTLSSLFSGDYFDGINLWFSDTYPFRENLVKVSMTTKKLIGISDKISHYSETKNEKIPEAESQTQNVVNVTGIQENEVSSTGSKDDLLSPALPSAEETTKSKSNGGKPIEQNLGSIYIYDNAGYEYYNFVKEKADKYAQAVNSAANELKAKNINVYNMLIPTSMDIKLSDDVRKKLNTSDQNEAINYITSKLNGNVKPVMIYDLERAHKNEYTYFRTDHHWSALGAYYAYAQFCSVSGQKYESLTKFTQYKFDNFLGSFYNDSGKSSALESSPDTVFAYKPPYNVSFKMQEKGSSSYIEWPLICDASSYSSSYKYLCFIGGDNPISVATNPSVTNGKKCVLVKESFGNAFAPYLTCNYQTVYIIDYRYFSGDITQFAIENGVNDVIIQNNISMTRNSDLISLLSENL